MTINDVSLIFGIPIGTEEVNMGYGFKPDTPFVRRRFRDVTIINATTIQKELNTAVKGNKVEDCRDVATLLCLYLFATLFFTSTGNTVKWSAVKYTENLEEMRNLNWSSLILDTLMSSVYRNFDKEPEKVSGCVPLLLVSDKIH